MAYWCSSSGKLELELSAEQAESASHSGSCDEDVMALSKEPDIAAQLAKLDAGELVYELEQYGAWNDEELSDHEQNLQRVLWIACGDIADGQCD